MQVRTRDGQQSMEGILHTPVSPGLAPSSSFPPFRRSDPHPSFTCTCFDDGILPTTHFSTLLPSPSSLRRLGSFPTGLPQQASSTPVSRSSHSILGVHPLSFSPLPSPQFSPSSPHLSPVLASVPIPSPPLPSLPLPLASLHSLLLHLRQVAQCFVPCPFSTDTPVTTCLCVGLSSFFLLRPFYFLLRLGSQPDIQEFSLLILKNTRFLYDLIYVSIIVSLRVPPLDGSEIKEPQRGRVCTPPPTTEGACTHLQNRPVTQKTLKSGVFLRFNHHFPLLVAVI